MAKIEFEAAVKALPDPGEKLINNAEWGRRLPAGVGSPNPRTREQQLRELYHRYRDTGLFKEWVTVEKRIEHGRIRYYFSRAVPQIYNPIEQAVELIIRPVLIPRSPRTPLVPSLIHVGDRFRGITPS